MWHWRLHAHELEKLNHQYPIPLSFPPPMNIAYCVSRVIRNYTATLTWII